jgi:Ca2+-binding EF-hand superfamily protein
LVIIIVVLIDLGTKSFCTNKGVIPVCKRIRCQVQAISESESQAVGASKKTTGQTLVKKTKMWRQLEQGLTLLSKREEDRLKKVYEYLDNNKDGKVCVNDLHQTLLSMKYEADKKELEDWIWEVRVKVSALDFS